MHLRRAECKGGPAQRSARVIFYNQTWARELGFNAPPSTADDFREQACKANASFRSNEDPKDDALGGWLVDYFSWEWCFFVNIPVGLLAAWAALTYVKEPRVKHTVQKIDWAGIGLLSVGIGSLQLFIEPGESKEWFETH